MKAARLSQPASGGRWGVVHGLDQPDCWENGAISAPIGCSTVILFMFER
jgi:hypothetical protein